MLMIYFILLTKNYLVLQHIGDSGEEDGFP